MNPYGSSTYHTDETTAPYIDHMHLDDTSDPSKEWLFGTTRSSSINASGSFIFIWKIDLDAAHNPRADNMQIKLLDSSYFPGNSYVSAVSPTMVGNEVHMIYKKDESGKLYYLVSDFTQAAATSTILYTGISGTNEAFFIGGL